MITKKNLRIQAERVYSIIKKGWCKGSSAIDKNGNWMLPSDELAVSFCLSGAFCRAKTDFVLINKFEEFLDGSMIDFNDNDSTTKRKVLAKLRAFIKSL